jgi:hypothetical protein
MMNVQLIRRVPTYDIFADDNRDPTWLEFVGFIEDDDEVWECRFTNDGSLDPQGLVIVREQTPIATYPPEPSRRYLN